MSDTNSAETLIEQLGLEPHPEGGWYRETWRGPDGEEGRAKGTAILFLLKADEASHWHRVDADEMWIWQGGDPLELAIALDDTAPAQTLMLGGNPVKGQELQGLVPLGAWQAARSTTFRGNAAGYSLVSCIVVPGFEFAGFELAPAGWVPGAENTA